MSRTIVDQRPPELQLHGIAGRAFAFDIPVTGGVLTSPVLTMRTGAGDPYTTDPGVGTATMVDADTLRIAWTADDMAALNTTTRGSGKTYRIEIAGSVDGGSVASIIGGTLSVYPTTHTRFTPNNAATLSLNNGGTYSLAITVPTPDAPIDGGAPDEVFLDGIDGGLYSDSFSNTTYDGGSI
jgi:hypothetical protein